MIAGLEGTAKRKAFGAVSGLQLHSDKNIAAAQRITGTDRLVAAVLKRNSRLGFLPGLRH